jgi:chromosome segregation ATPase
MRILNIFILLLLMFYPTSSYSKSNSKFNEIENKINYLNNRIVFLDFELGKAQQIIFRTNALIAKKESFTSELEDRLNSLSDCGNEIKIRSADFRLQKWLFTFFKKIKSQKKHIIHRMCLAGCEITKSNLDNEAACLKTEAESLTQDSCGFLTCSIDQLLTRINFLQDSYTKLKKEECCLISKIEELENTITTSRNKFCGYCCWI